MVNIHIDPVFDDAERRRRLYSGDVIVYSQVPEVAAFAEFTRNLIVEEFGADPIAVHERQSSEQLADALISFKPAFIHNPESIGHVKKITEALGCSPEELHADVPKLRTAFPAGGLSTGIAYAFQAHRDTWYAAPPQQVNWWLPVWPVAHNNAMEFYPRGFGTVVENNSELYNYYEANAWRGRIKDFSGGKDTRVHPAPSFPLPEDEQRLCVVPPLGGVMLFSGDQLHATTPNTSSVTRYSIDFRTVHAPDVASGVGAPRADVRCQGTSLRDFRRLSDKAEFTDEDAAPYDTVGAQAAGVTVFSPV